MIRRCIFFCSFLISLVAIGLSSTHAEDQTPLNPGTGVWWKSLSHVQKDIAVGGLMAGFQTGYIVGIAKTLHHANLTPQQENSVSDKAISDKPDFSQRNVGAMVDAIDRIFNDHPEILNQQVALFLVCAANGSDCAGEIKLAQSFASGSKP